MKIEDTLSKVSGKYGTKNFNLVKELVDIVISSQSSFESISGKQKDLQDLEKYLEKLCTQILDMKNQDFHQCVQGMKPLYLKVKETNLRFEQIDQRINECERSIKFKGGIDEIHKLQNNALYYEELERGFELLERYEVKFIKAAEYENRNDYIMCVRTIENIEKLFHTNKKEFVDFPDLMTIIKSKISNYYTSLKANLQTKIINFVFLKSEEAQNTILKKIIKEVKQENKENKKAKDNIDGEIEDFFEFICRTEFPLSESIELMIVKTLSRKDRRDNIKKIKRILKKYQEDQINPSKNQDDPDYEVNQEIIQKITQFFAEYSESELILNRSEAYLISCIMALKLLEGGEDGMNSSRANQSEYSSEFCSCAILCLHLIYSNELAMD